MHAASRRPARSESKSSSASVTSIAVACTCDSAQRSSSARVGGWAEASSPPAAPGSQPLTVAYSVWKAAVFQ